MYLMVVWCCVLSFIGPVVVRCCRPFLSSDCAADFSSGGLHDATMIQKLWRQRITINVYLSFSGDT